MTAGGNSRPQRVADQIQRDLASLIQFEVKDPRIGFVTVAGVKVSKDMSYADIYVSELGKDDDENHKKTIVEALQHCAGFLRGQLAKGSNLRSIPKLRFHYDDTTQKGVEMSALIDKAVSSGGAASTQFESDDDNKEA